MSSQPVFPSRIFPAPRHPFHDLWISLASLFSPVLVSLNLPSLLNSLYLPLLSSLLFPHPPFFLLLVSFSFDDFCVLDLLLILMFFITSSLLFSLIGSSNLQHRQVIIFQKSMNINYPASQQFHWADFTQRSYRSADNHMGRDVKNI